MRSHKGPICTGCLVRRRVQRRGEDSESHGGRRTEALESGRSFPIWREHRPRAFAKPQARYHPGGCAGPGRRVPSRHLLRFHAAVGPAATRRAWRRRGRPARPEDRTHRRGGTAAAGLAQELKRNGTITPVQNGSVEPGPGQQRASQVGRHQQRLLEVGVTQVGFTQVRLTQVGTPEHGSLKAGPKQRRGAQVSAVQKRQRQPGMAADQRPEVAPAEVRPGNLDRPQVRVQKPHPTLDGLAREPATGCRRLDKRNGLAAVSMIDRANRHDCVFRLRGCARPATPAAHRYRVSRCAERRDGQKPNSTRPTTREWCEAAEMECRRSANSSARSERSRRFTRAFSLEGAGGPRGTRLRVAGSGRRPFEGARQGRGPSCPSSAPSRHLLSGKKVWPQPAHSTFDASLRRGAPDSTDPPTHCPLPKEQAAPHANLAGALG